MRSLLIPIDDVIDDLHNYCEQRDSEKEIDGGHEFSFTASILSLSTSEVNGTNGPLLSVTRAIEALRPRLAQEWLNEPSTEADTIWARVAAIKSESLDLRVRFWTHVPPSLCARFHFRRIVILPFAPAPPSRVAGILLPRVDLYVRVRAYNKFLHSGQV
jgi:hypothetical protein